MRQLTVGTLFSGIGAGDLAFERAGFKPIWQVEIDKACQGVLGRHWPDVPRYGDICDCGIGRTHELERPDVIMWGSPCQDLSVAGQRAGIEGQRSGLFYEGIRILRELSPIISIWENVPGALSSNSGRDFATILTAFHELGTSDIAWRIIDAQYSGVPQRRRRIFLVADITGGRAGEILLDCEGVRRDTSPRREAGQEVAGTLGGGSSSRGWCSDTDRTTLVPAVAPLTTNPWADNESQESKLVVASVTSKWAKGTGGPAGDECQNLVASALSASAGHHGHSSPRGDGSDNLVIAKPRGGFGWSETEGVTPTLESQGGSHQGGPDNIPFIFEPRVARNGRGAPEDICPPLKAESGQTGKGDSAPCVAFAIQERAVCENPNAGPDGIGVREGIAYTLEARAVPQAVAFSCKDSGADAGPLAPTLRAMDFDGSHANGGGQVAVAFQTGGNIAEELKGGPGVCASGVRRLTPL